MRRLALAAALLVAVTGATAQADATLGKWGVETQYIDPAIQPGDDFYRYVNEGWLKTAKIPQGLPLYGAMVEVALRTEQQLKQILDDLPKTGLKPGTPAQQLADLRASYLDLDRRNALGMSMLKEGLDAALKANDRGTLARLMGRIGYDSLFDGGVERDPGEPTRYVFALGQGGLGLPGRDYYLNKGEPYAGFRKAYQDYIAGTFRRAGVGNGKRKAAAILAFETEIARRQWTPTEERDALKNYDRKPLATLVAYAPGFDWRAFLAEGGFGDVQEVLLGTNTAVQRIAKLYARTPMDTLRAYVAFHYLDGHAGLLSQPWVDAQFDFYSRKLSGIAEPRPLEIRAVRFVSHTLGEQLGRLYVERYFPPESKAAIEKLVGYELRAFRERLRDNAWMDEATKREAFAKLDAFKAKVGYADRWHDLSGVRIAADDLVGNVERLERWGLEDARAKLKEPARDWEWAMFPQTVNAYYSSTSNEIVFPAAILQPPLFDPKADPAVNFGAIGVIIGHEMGHGFDDQGSRYDGAGRLRNWWTARARANFDARTQRLAKQYDRYSPLPGLHLNGELTLGENLGDLGGVTVAHAAYRGYVAEELKGAAPVIDGYTGDQRFFLGFAQTWREVQNEQSLREQVLTDPHSPNAFRVNGILRNFDPWYAAFGVGRDAKLYLPEDERVSLW
ncbi:MAG TPA: M13 family metallopeptidase [Burkholderiales bacterium]|nr:M13 family metallopeptidase [Burkholderiales bacterium]